jgi:hypothetical protein
LRKDSNVISPAVPTNIFSGLKQRVADPALYFLPELFHTPGVNQKGQPSLIAGFPKAVVSKDQSNMMAKLRCLVRVYENI